MADNNKYHEKSISCHNALTDMDIEWQTNPAVGIMYAIIAFIISIPIVFFILSMQLSIGTVIRFNLETFAFVLYFFVVPPSIWILYKEYSITKDKWLLNIPLKYEKIELIFEKSNFCERIDKSEIINLIKIEPFIKDNFRSLYRINEKYFLEIYSNTTVFDKPDSSLLYLGSVTNNDSVQAFNTSNEILKLLSHDTIDS